MELIGFLENEDRWSFWGGGGGGGCFYWLNNKQAFCLAEIWPLSSILDLDFPGNQNDLLFEEVTFEHRGMTYYVMMYK